MTNTEDLDISGLDKAELLRRLFNASRPLGLGALQPYEAEMSHEEAQELCGEYAKLNASFDYIRSNVPGCTIETTVWAVVRRLSRSCGPRPR